jgi:hypothetical protein
MGILFDIRSLTRDRGRLIMSNTPKNEIDYITSVWETISTEEFPEGPYGSSLNPFDRPGKVTPWESGQQVVSRYKDENPAFSEGTMPPPGDQPPGSQI